MKPLLKLAIKIARKSIKHKYNFVAILTNKNDKILSIGFNSFTKTHPIQAKYAHKYQSEKIFLHAEIDALTKHHYHHIPHKIYVARVNRLGKIRYAHPCPICMAALTEAGVKEIYYTQGEI